MMGKRNQLAKGHEVNIFALQFNKRIYKDLIFTILKFNSDFTEMWIASSDALNKYDKFKSEIFGKKKDEFK